MTRPRYRKSVISKQTNSGPPPAQYCAQCEVPGTRFALTEQFGVSGQRAAAAVAVLSEEGDAGEGLATAWTAISLHLGVRLQVGAQVGAVRKATPTVIAGKRLLTYKREHSE